MKTIENVFKLHFRRKNILGSCSIAVQRRDFGKRLTPSNLVTEKRSVLNEVNDQSSGKDKLHHLVAGPLLVLSVEKQTATIQLEEVVERFSLDRRVTTPNHLSTYDSNLHSATTSDVHAKNIQWRNLSFKRIVAHREKMEGGLEFMIAWEGGYLPA